MTISNVSGAAPTTFAGISGGGLSPDSLMIYCATQLNSLDSQIQTSMDEQTKTRDIQSKLTALKSTLANGSLERTNKDVREKALNEMKELYDSLPPDDPKRQQLDDLFRNFAGTCCLDNDMNHAYSLATVSKDDITKIANFDPNNGLNGADAGEIKGFCDTVDGMLTDVSKGSELKMIQLNSLISQRQMAVQMTTGMMQKLNETLAGITANFGK